MDLKLLGSDRFAFLAFDDHTIAFGDGLTIYADENCQSGMFHYHRGRLRWQADSELIWRDGHRILISDMFVRAVAQGLVQLRPLSEQPDPEPPSDGAAITQFDNATGYLSRPVDTRAWIDTPAGPLHTLN